MKFLLLSIVGLFFLSFHSNQETIKHDLELPPKSDYAERLERFANMENHFVTSLEHASKIRYTQKGE